MWIFLVNIQGTDISHYSMVGVLQNIFLSQLWCQHICPKDSGWLWRNFCPKFIFKFSFDKSHKQVSWILINFSDKVSLLIVKNLRHITGVSLSEWRQEVWLQLRLRGKCWIAGDTVLAGLYTITTPENIFCSNIFFSLTKKAVCDKQKLSSNKVLFDALIFATKYKQHQQ